MEPAATQPANRTGVQTTWHIHKPMVSADAWLAIRLRTTMVALERERGFIAAGSRMNS